MVTFAATTAAEEFWYAENTGTGWEAMRQKCSLAVASVENLHGKISTVDLGSPQNGACLCAFVAVCTEAHFEDWHFIILALYDAPVFVMFHRLQQGCLNPKCEHSR